MATRELVKAAASPGAWGLGHEQCLRPMGTALGLESDPWKHEETGEDSE